MWLPDVGIVLWPINDLFVMFTHSDVVQKSCVWVSMGLLGASFFWTSPSFFWTMVPVQKKLARKPCLSKKSWPQNRACPTKAAQKQCFSNKKMTSKTEPTFNLLCQTQSTHIWPTHRFLVDYCLNLVVIHKLDFIGRLPESAALKRLNCLIPNDGQHFLAERTKMNIAQSCVFADHEKKTRQVLM